MLGKQMGKQIQNLMKGLLIMALAALLAMIATCLQASRYDSGVDAGWDHLPQTNLDGLGKLVTAALFSQLCHQGVPTLMQGMRNKAQASAQKSALNRSLLPHSSGLFCPIVVSFDTFGLRRPRASSAAPLPSRSAYISLSASAPTTTSARAYCQ
jgi:hypothetical protein